MPPLDNLPGDQRAVLEMVLKRGRSYDEIARLLSLDSAKVRERAQIALDTIGPHTEVAPEHQHRIADYLLGQLPDDEVHEVRDLLADSPSDRAWARVVASELAPLTGDRPLPEIPVERSAPREPDAPPPPTPGPAPDAPTPAARPEEPQSSEGVAVPAISSLGPGQPESEPKRRRGRRRRGDGDDGAPATEAPAKRSSRLGGALVILVGVIAIAVALVFVLRGGHSKKHPTSVSTAAGSPAATGSSTTTASSPTSSTPTTSTSTSSASVVAQINLKPPSSAKQSKTAGIAEVLNEGSTDGVAIVAQNVPPNKTKPPDAYAVWLYNSAKDAKLLGFVNPSVGKNGRLSTAGGLPSNASHYKQLIVTLETTASPKQPGSIVLQGALTGL